MAIQYRSSALSTNGSSFASTLTLNKPSGVVTNDVLVAIISIRNTRTVSSVPSGFTQRVQGGVGTSNSSIQTIVYTKVATGSEPATYDFVISSSTPASGIMLRYSGVDTATPVEASAGTSSSSLVAPTITTVSNNSVVLGIPAVNNNGSNGGTTASDFSGPGGETERIDYGSVGQINNAVYEKLFVTAGATGTSTYSSNVTGAGAAVHIALKPAPDVVNANPVASAGSNQTVYAKTTVVLDASASSDAEDTSGQADSSRLLTYLWEYISGPVTPTIKNPNIQKAQVYLSTTGTYVFRVTVTDSSAGSSTANVTITVGARPTVKGVAVWNGSRWQNSSPSIHNGSSWGGVTPSGFVYPSSYTTGVPAGTPLTVYNGNFTTSYRGQVVENLNIKGSIEVQHQDVIIRFCRVENYIRSNGNSPIIEDCTVAPPDSQWFDANGQPTGNGIALDFGIGYSHFTARRVNIYGFGDAFKAAGNSVVEDCYIHDLYAYLKGDGVSVNHDDGVQLVAGDNVTIRGNYIDPRGWYYTGTHTNGGTSCVIIKADDGPISNVTVENNLLQGAGSFTLYAHPVGANTLTNIVIQSNRFMRNVWSLGSQYGVLQYSQSAEAQITWSGNVWDDTGATIPLGTTSPTQRL